MWRPFFHGVSRSAYERASEEGPYKPLMKIKLCSDYSTAFGDVFGQPDRRLLVVDPDMATGFRDNGRFDCDSLEPDAYIAVDIRTRDDNKFQMSPETIRDIEIARQKLARRATARSKAPM